MSAISLPPRDAVAPATGGRVLELLAVGGLTPLLFVASWLLRESLGLQAAEYAVGFTFFYAAHLLNDPHFSVTYLLFYRDARGVVRGEGGLSRGQRARWIAAGVIVPAALGAWALGALAAGSAEALGAMMQLMFLLVGWHYVKQGFGVMIVLSARRGVRYSSGERAAILAHCLAAWAYAWASPFDPGRAVEEKGVLYTTIAHPRWLEELTLAAFVLSALVLFAVLLAKRRVEGRLPIVTPLVGLLCAIWAWSVFSSIDPLVRYAVPALHSLQYLWFVGLLERNQAREREGPPFFEAPARTRLTHLALAALALGLFLFDLAPAVLDGAFAPSGAQPRDPALGATPWLAALYAFVNLHHYFMDAVLWRRENPRMRYLAN